MCVSILNDRRICQVKTLRVKLLWPPSPSQNDSEEVPFLLLLHDAFRKLILTKGRSPYWEANAVFFKSMYHAYLHVSEINPGVKNIHERTTDTVKLGFIFTLDVCGHFKVDITDEIKEHFKYARERNEIVIIS